MNIKKSSIWSPTPLQNTLNFTTPGELFNGVCVSEGLSLPTCKHTPVVSIAVQSFASRLIHSGIIYLCLWKHKMPPSSLYQHVVLGSKHAARRVKTLVGHRTTRHLEGTNPQPRFVCAPGRKIMKCWSGLGEKNNKDSTGLSSDPGIALQNIHECLFSLCVQMTPSHCSILRAALSVVWKVLFTTTFGDSMHMCR